MILSTICSNGVNTVLEAYIVGLDPNDPNAEFLTSLLSGNALQWNTASGRVYSVWWTTNLLENFQPFGNESSLDAGRVHQSKPKSVRLLQNQG